MSNYHIGLVYCIHVNEKIAIKEVDKMLGKWATEEEIKERYEQLESWSQIAWDSQERWKI